MKSARSTVPWAAILLTVVSGLGLPSCGSDTPTNTQVPAADVTITIVANSGSNSYSPNPKVITVGQTVAWKNSATDNAVHTATSDTPGAFNTGNIAQGATSAPITMGTAGSFPYHCAIHGMSMTGTLTVNPLPAPSLVTITIVGGASSGSSSYDPNPTTVSVGDTVQWMNMPSDNQPHTATSTTLGVFDTGNIAVGATSAKIVMTTAGSFPYLCTLHSNMTGTLTVNPSVNP